MTPPFVVGVVGFPRSGSSMMMRMLDQGGIPPVAGSQAVSYEVAGGMQAISRMRDGDLAGRAVKLLDFGQRFALPRSSWRFVWLDRDPEQQAKSLVKFARGIAEIDLPRSAWKRLAESMRHDRAALIATYRERGPLHIESYEGILAHPRAAATRIADFLPALDPERASSVPTARSPQCAPDLAFEFSSVTQ